MRVGERHAGGPSHPGCLWPWRRLPELVPVLPGLSQGISAEEFSTWLCHARVSPHSRPLFMGSHESVATRVAPLGSVGVEAPTPVQSSGAGWDLPVHPRSFTA